jgi:hypothetical protein
MRTATVSSRIEQNYEIYAREVNAFRALPLALDGLKLVQRRLFINGAKLCANSLVKSNSIIGDTISHNHPHGDVSLYQALVNLVNDYNPLFEGQGNWGGFSHEPAAMRYTSAKLSPFAKEFFLPFIRYTEFYENELGHQEQKHIPTLIPYALVNGSSGIGVGIGTKIPAFTLASVKQYIAWLLSPSGKSAPELKINWESYDMDDSLITKGTGRVVYHQIYSRQTIDGVDAYVIRANPPNFNLIEKLFKVFNTEITQGKVFVRDQSSGKEGFKIVVGKGHWFNMDLLEPRLKALKVTTGYMMNWSMGTREDLTATRLSPPQVLEESLKVYTQAMDEWKKDQIQKLQLEIMFHERKAEIMERLVQKLKWKEIQQVLQLSAEEIAFIKAKSVNQLSNEDRPTSRLRTEISKIKKTQIVV